jgi:hypothetical protein
MTSENFEKRLSELEAVVKVIQASIQAMAKASPKGGGSQTSGIEPGNDKLLDGPYGDPEVKYDPKFWKGDSMVGKRFSQCPSSYLEATANYFGWRMKKLQEEGAEEKKVNYAKFDAMKALGWKRRIDAGFAPKVSDTDPPSGSDDEIPF